MTTETTEGRMKCVLASKFGDIDEVLDVSSDWPAPECGGAKGRELLLRVHACALGPQDVYMIHGDFDFVLKPESFPYVPGMEVCGIVEQVAPGETRFKVGDRVAVSNGALPVGGLAEKAVMPASEAVLVPDGVSSVAAAALVNSPYCALEFVKGAKVAAGERVLVLGGSGGVGSAVVQLAKIAGAAYVAATSTDEPLLKSLGADRVINYREENFWEIEEFQTSPFDVVIDCIGTRDAWYNSRRSGVLKSGWQHGRFVAVSLISERPQVHSAFQMAQMMLPALFRSIGSFLYPWVARYSFPIVMSAKGEHLKELFDLVETGRLKPVLERASPFPFTLEGVKAAFQLQASKHAHGKVVIEMT